MNILILNWRDLKHPLAGGAEIALLEHATYWQKKGAEITWFGSSFTGAKDKETINGITYLRKGSQYTVHFWAFLYYLQNKLGKQDIVVDCFHFLPFFTPLYFRKTKIIVLIHEVAKEVWFKNLPWVLAVIGSHVEPLFFKLYKQIPFITVSNSTKKELVTVGIEEKNIQVIENGISIPKVKKFSKEKDPTILFLGRIAKDKGIEDAIEAFTHIYKKDNKTQFWIAGSGDVKYIQRLKSSHIQNLTSNIKFYGFVSEQKKYELLQKAWVLVHPSTREGWGLTVIEANSVGTPVVGYDVPGLRDSIQDKKTGLLVRSNADSLAEGVSKLIEDKKLYEKLSSNAKIWSKRFDWQKAGAKSWSMLKEIVLV